MERKEQLQWIVEAALLAAGGALTLDNLLDLFLPEERPEKADLRDAITVLQQEYEGRSIELVEVGGAYRINVRATYAPWVSRLWEERPPRYSRALLETLALVAYRQPITRSEIEEIRGVSVSSNIIKTLMEREWIREVGHRDVPGKPALLATTKQFLADFGLKSLDMLPTLSEIKDLDSINCELQLEVGSDNAEMPEALSEAVETETSSESGLEMEMDEFEPEAVAEGEDEVRGDTENHD
jgi:segregation and condensation protein B